MNISDIRIRLIKRDETKFRAVASIIIDDCFVIHDIKIIEAFWKHTKRLCAKTKTTRDLVSK